MTSPDSPRCRGVEGEEVSQVAHADLLEHFAVVQKMLLDKLPISRADVVGLATTSKGKELQHEADKYLRGPQTPVAIFKSDQYFTIVYENDDTGPSSPLPSVSVNLGTTVGSFRTAPEEMELTQDMSEETMEIMDETPQSTYSDGMPELSFLLPGAVEEHVKKPPSAPGRSIERVEKEAPTLIAQPQCSTPRRGSLSKSVAPPPRCSPIKRRLLEDAVSGAFKTPYCIPVRFPSFGSSGLNEEECEGSKTNNSRESNFRDRLKKGATSRLGSSTCSSKCSKRSSRVDYSWDEIKALQKGLKKYGPDFKSIWLAYRSVFHPKRTPVSLYDKWRHDKSFKEKPRQRN